MRNRDAEAEAEAVRWVSFVGGGWLRMKCPHFGGSLIAEAESRKRKRKRGSGSDTEIHCFCIPGARSQIINLLAEGLMHTIRSSTPHGIVP